jgi:hypothetical protein
MKIVRVAWRVDFQQLSIDLWEGVEYAGGNRVPNNTRQVQRYQEYLK